MKGKPQPRPLSTSTVAALLLTVLTCLGCAHRRETLAATPEPSSAFVTECALLFVETDAIEAGGPSRLP